MKKKLFASIFLLVMTCLSTGTVFASNSISSEIELRTSKVLVELFRDISEPTSNKVNSVKTVYDFDGNEYKVVEGAPQGYLIFSVNSGVVVEHSYSSISPYFNTNGKLFYGGPNFYYSQKDNYLNHTIIDENHNIEQIDNFKLSSRNLNEMLFQMKDTVILDYINKGIKTPEQLTDQSRATGTVDNPGFYENLDSFGGMSGGVCGFIGLNMLIGYHDKYKNESGEDIMDDIYWTDTNKTGLKSNNESLSKYLYDLDPKDGTTSVHIHNVMQQYSNERNLTYDHTSRYKPFYTIATITNAIDRNTPVEVFGSLGNPSSKGGINHAVVVYKYKTYKNFLGIVYKADYTVHFGWSGYNSVVITGTIGSIYFFENQ